MKTAVGAKSQAIAAHGPPSLISAAAATAEQSIDKTTPVISDRHAQLKACPQDDRQSRKEGHQDAAGVGGSPLGEIGEVDSRPSC